jgi:hypothetical protein
MSRWHARLAELRASRTEDPIAVQIVQNVQNSPAAPTFEHAAPTFEHFEHIEQRTEPARSPVASSDADERAAFIEYDGGAPREWAEAMARLDPARPPADVPPKRWVEFMDDCARFLDDGWAERAAALGWGPLDLFGCHRERPLVRHDHAGLLWLLQGRRLIALSEMTAIIETATGARQTYYRMPVAAGAAVLPWQLQ